MARNGISSLCVSYVKELQEGIHDLRVDIIKCALFSTEDMDYTTTAYSTTNEITGTGYTAGGVTATLLTPPTIMGKVAAPDYADVSWPTATFSAWQALWYNSSKANRAIAVASFPDLLTTTNATFTLEAPPFTESEAMFRITVNAG